MPKNEVGDGKGLPRIKLSVARRVGRIARSVVEEN